MEKISILVPCCNVERYVRECLDSIKAQTYTNLEIICIDDGSTDSTGSIIDEYVTADARFKVIHKPNSGYGDSMNRGLEMCTGDYVGIIESDDWIEPDMFEVLLGTCLDHDLDLVHCLWQQGPTGTEGCDRHTWIKQDTVYRPLDARSVMLMQPSIWAALYRRDLLEDGRKVRFLPTPGASFQDTSFAFKAYTKSRRFMMLSRALHHYRVNPNSSVASSGKIYCVIDEWREMQRWIDGDKDLKAEMAKTDLLMRIIHGGFVWNYQRLTMAPKLLFLRAAARFFRELEADGLLNLLGCADDNDAKDLMLTMKDPLAYHRAQVYVTVDALFAGREAKRTEGKEALISVIVPCYNTAKYIQSSLESITRQGYRNLEIICVDDCSTDETPMLVRHIMRKDSRIKFLCTEKNSGLSASRNLALDNAHGEYVVFVDGDDCLMPDAIVTMYAEMNDGVDIVMGSTVVGYEGGREAYGDLPKSDDGYYKVRNRMLVDIKEKPGMVLGVSVNAWGKLWRRAALDKYNIRFPEGLLYEDANFLWKYLCVKSKMLFLTSSVYYYHRHLTGSIMSSTFNKESGYAIHHLYILDDLYKYVCSNGFEEIGKKFLNVLYEQYFWLAYNLSPDSDHDEVLATMCRILKDHGADVENNALLEYISGYEDVPKADLFMDVYKLMRDNKRKRSLWKKITGHLKHKNK